MGGLVSKKEAFFDLDNPLAPLPHLLRAANGLWILLRYVAKTFVPLGLVGRPLGPRPRSRHVSFRPARGRRSRRRPRPRGGGPGGAATAAPRFPRNRVLPRDDPPDVERLLPHRDDLRRPSRLSPVGGAPRGGGRPRRGAPGVSRAASGPPSSASSSRRTRVPPSRGTRSSATTSGSSTRWSRRSRVPRAPGTTWRPWRGRAVRSSRRGRASRRRSRSFRATTTRGRSSLSWPARRAGGTTPGPPIAGR